MVLYNSKRRDDDDDKTSTQTVTGDDIRWLQLLKDVAWSSTSNTEWLALIEWRRVNTVCRTGWPDTPHNGEDIVDTR